MTEAPIRIGFVLAPRFPLISFAPTCEALRYANDMAGTQAYDWQILTHDGEPALASNGIRLPVDGQVKDWDGDLLLVCAGFEVERFTPPALLSMLRAQRQRGKTLGSICSGAHILAKAGLMAGYETALHWENQPAFSENFDDVEVSADRYAIDRDRISSAGGIAALDMMLHLISRDLGGEIAAKVAAKCMHEWPKKDPKGTRAIYYNRLGVQNQKLLRAIALMEQNLEEPLGRAELATEVGLSARQLERLFKSHLSSSPAKFYLNLRLERARLLLFHTGMSITEAGMACGFISASHFSHCYHDAFGTRPKNDRALWNQSQGHQILAA